MDLTGGRCSQGKYIPQELLKEISKMGNRLLIGIPRERNEEERRLPLTPEAVDMLTDCGHRVVVETNAGLGINYSDNHFSEAGAEIVATPQEVYQADLILKILPPLPGEVALMKPRSTLFSLVQLNSFAPEAFELMMSKRINAIGYELLADDQNKLPVLNIISEIEGKASISIAAEMLSNARGGKGLLFGGISGVPPTEVVIVGAGIAGTAAARAALGMGAMVKVFDEDINKLRTIQQVLGQSLFTSNFQPNVLHNAFRSADVVIGAMRYINSRKRYVIAEEMISSMKKGALIIDLRVNQGGCFETTCGLTPSDPSVFQQYGIFHYCKSNVSNYVARTTAMGFSNIFVPMLFSIGDMGSVQALIKADMGFRAGIYMYAGKPVNRYVANHFNLSSADISIYLSAF